MKYTETKLRGNKQVKVNIRLDDECKNGHQAFAITGTVYEKDGRGRWVDVAGSCVHEDIAEFFPEFKPFIRLHLCDYAGVPMYAVENGFYHLTEGFNNTKPGTPEFAAEYCEYYRITSEQFEALNACPSKVQFALALESLGILAQWKAEADLAIAQIEALTGEKFVNTSTRSQYNRPTKEQIDAENKRIAEGYYTAEGQAEREKAAIAFELAKLQKNRNAKLVIVNREYEVKAEVLRVGGVKALDNCIFYTHSNELAFNWKPYGQIDNAEQIIAQLFLPDGVTAKIAEKRS